MSTVVWEVLFVDIETEAICKLAVDIIPGHIGYIASLITLIEFI